MAILTGAGYHTERIDGREVQKPLPKLPHARIQRYLIRVLSEKLAAGYEVLLELNVICGEDRVVPDVTVASLSAHYVDGDLADRAPLCIEIMSPGQTLSSLFDRAERLLNAGVGMCWVIWPERRQVWMYTANEVSEAGKNLSARLSAEQAPVTINTADLWASLD